jgi:hypothetical protein
MATNETSAPPSIATQWASIRALYPIYAALANKFELGTPPYASVEEMGAQSEQEVIARVRLWFSQMDECIQPHQFRQMLQATGIAYAEDQLKALVRRHLEKPARNNTERDKLDLLLTQYFFVCAPPSFRSRDVTVEEVAEVLEPVLGERIEKTPQWLEPASELIDALRSCNSLQQLESLGIVQRGRQLKGTVGEKYFSATALVVFTHFSCCLRRAFAALFAAELLAIESGLERIEDHGTHTIDCSKAGLSAEEPIPNIRNLLDTIKTTAAPEYVADISSKRLLMLRAVVDAALSSTAAMTAADRTQLGQLESEVQELREHVAQLQAQHEQLSAAMAELACRLNEARELTSRNHDAQSSGILEPPVATVAPPECRNDAPTTAIATSAPPPAAAADPGMVPKEALDAPSALNKYVEKLRTTIKQAGPKFAGLVRIGSETLLLNEGELQVLQASATGGDADAQLIERAIVIRLLLVHKIERTKGGDLSDLVPFVNLARQILTDLQPIGGMHGSVGAAARAAARQLLTVTQHGETAGRKARLASATATATA